VRCRISACANTAANFVSAHDSSDAIAVTLEDTIDYALS
jgi:hypothetical protein